MLFSLFKKPIPFYITALLMLSAVAATFAVIKIENGKYYPGGNSTSASSSNNDNVTEESFGDILLLRKNGNKLTQPILVADAGTESEKLGPLKSMLADSVARLQQQGVITDASVFVGRLNEGDWIDVNPEETFRPRSLVKVPILIAYLKMAEADPSVMKRTFFYNKPDSTMPVQKYSNKTIQPGRLYSTRELLQEMIINSDNYATVLLFEHIDTVALKQLYNTLRIDGNGIGKMSYQISSANYAKFFQVLYNASYLTLDDSEFALSLLTKTDFKLGICQQLPPGIVVAHKFGENNTDDSKQLHECGIIYLSNKPYLITIMTRGNDLDKLPAVISNLSKQVFDYMQNNS